MLCLVPKPSIVVKFPRPDTAGDEYKASDGSCFKVAPRRVECGKDGATVLPQPIADYTTPSDSGLTFKNPFDKS
jgi:hypothetical protein